MYIYTYIYIYIYIYIYLDRDLRGIQTPSWEAGASAGAEAATATCMTPECYTQPCGVTH